MCVKTKYENLSNVISYNEVKTQMHERLPLDWDFSFSIVLPFHLISKLQ